MSQTLALYKLAMQPESITVKLDTESYEMNRDKIAALSRGWDVCYHGKMKSQAIEFLCGQADCSGVVPLAGWLDEAREDVNYPRANFDCTQEGTGVRLHATAFAETRGEAIKVLKKLLPKSMSKELTKQ